MLFGPGVIDVANENIKIEIKSVGEKISMIIPMHNLVALISH